MIKNINVVEVIYFRELSNRVDIFYKGFTEIGEEIYFSCRIMNKHKGTKPINLIPYFHIFLIEEFNNEEIYESVFKEFNESNGGYKSNSLNVKNFLNGTEDLTFISAYNLNQNITAQITRDCERLIFRCDLNNITYNINVEILKDIRIAIKLLFNAVKFCVDNPTNSIAVIQYVTVDSDGEFKEVYAELSSNLPSKDDIIHINRKEYIVVMRRYYKTGEYIPTMIRIHLREII